MSCGDINYWGKSKIGETRPFREHCDRWDCPSCRKKLIAKQSVKADERLSFAIPEYGRLYHYQISFRKIRGRTEAQKWAKKVGLLGGSICEHRKEMRPGQHFHSAAFGKIDFHHVQHIGLGNEMVCRQDKCKLPIYKHDRGEIVIKRIRPIKNIFKLHRYELGHAYTSSGKQIISWWGVVSPRTLGYKKEEYITKSGPKAGTIGRRLPKGEFEPILDSKGNQMYKCFDPKDEINEYANEALIFKHPLRILEWKTRYKQKVL